MHLEGTAVVTGAASGIGLAIAEACAKHGMSLVMADIEERRLAKAAAALADNGFRALAVTTDVSDAAAVEYLAKEAESLGPVTLLVNNAGVGTVGPPVWELENEDWQWVLGVNLNGVINGLAAFLPGMVERDKGHIVNTASAAGLLAPRGMAPYVASKHAIVALSEALSHELAAAGSEVAVTVLCPGLVATRMADNERNRPVEFQLSGVETASRAARYADDLDGMKRAVAGGREPAEIADLVLDAVETRKFYLVPDPWIITAAAQRFNRIISSGNPVDPS